ncbi:hypothetical protein B0H16DRAFT_1728475 [Mycena metata]|uniref:Uncharacterized protein n=1 Tax=Mycena metata TaxID=1033252 RepID=A0AAD7N1N4_9AGAR|nr:hypothetical protein B0H16DRAFT_1728475 [Mycena metata]
MGQTGDRADWLRVVAGEGYSDTGCSRRRSSPLSVQANSIVSLPDRSLHGLNQHGPLAQQLLSL